MPKLDRLTYYRTNVIPTRPDRASEEQIRSATQLDHFLFKQISATENVGPNESVKQSDLLLFSLQHYAGVRLRRNIPNRDAFVYRDFVVSTCDWIDTLVKKANLNQQQKAILSKGLYSNELGRAGLSIVVEVCSNLLASKAKIYPIHFAQIHESLPEAASALQHFATDSAYFRYYYQESSDGYPVPKDRKQSNAFVKCSFSGLSIALIRKMAMNISLPEAKGYLKNIRPQHSDMAERTAIWSELQEGIFDNTGLVSTLARRITT